MRLSSMLLALHFGVILFGWPARSTASPLPGEPQSGSTDIVVTPNAAAATFRLLDSFTGGRDGANPRARLLHVNGLLYGTTYAGGPSGIGTIFEVNPTTGVEHQLYSFSGSALDGVNPYGGLVELNGLLYGTTNGGGRPGAGTLFEVNPSSGAEFAVYAFKGNPDGANPQAGLLVVSGLLYGTTYAGGTHNVGTVFEVNPLNGRERVLFNFDGPNGANPTTDLIAVNGRLYGTTSGGGPDNDGTVFEVDPSTGAERMVYSFYYFYGQRPSALVELDGLLYGTTNAGGRSGLGTVFSVDPSTDTERVLCNFNYPGGTYPNAGLVAVDGLLYGTTVFGGSPGYGTVYEVDPSSGAERVIYNFGPGGGSTPYAALIEVNGLLYGTTYFGGTSDLARISHGKIEKGCLFLA